MTSSSRPRLVVSDLDGTLLRSDGTVSERTRGVLAALEAAGIQIVFATGRPPRWVRPVGQVTGRLGTAILSNGALVYDLRTERILERHLLSVSAGRRIVELVGAALPGAAFSVELGESVRYEGAYPVRSDYGPRVEVPRGELFDLDAAVEGVVKLLIRETSYDTDVLLAKTRELAGDLAEFTHSRAHGLIEVSAHGVSKASTLMGFCAARGIAASEVIAFGDAVNDLAMLEWSGRSYAVANAHPEVMEIVDDVCPSNDEDGVASILETLL